jgi:aldehyde dehydrogenase (NAD+)
VWGKFLNAGQTCVAPDYVYAQASIAPRLVERLVACIRDFYGNEPRDSADYARMISVRHAERIAAFFRDGTPACGGTADAAARYVAPTVLTGVSWESPVMSEEIFGPVLPVLTWDTEAEAWHRLYGRETPLAQYLFTRSRATERFFMNGLRFGGGCVNDTVIHVANPHLPFGGIGASGMGAYHGVKSFETFTHYKSIMKKTSLFDIPLRYPPYTAKKLSWVKRFLG